MIWPQKVKGQTLCHLRSVPDASLKQLLPKILSDALPTALTENVQKAVTDSLPSYRYALQKESTQVKQSAHLQFVITGVPENESSYLKQLEADSKVVDEAVQMKLCLNNWKQIQKLSFAPKWKNQQCQTPWKAFEPGITSTQEMSPVTDYLKQQSLHEQLFCEESSSSGLPLTNLREKVIISRRTQARKRDTINMVQPNPEQRIRSFLIQNQRT